MNEDILKKLERKIDRRSFLRGSGLAAAAVVGVAAVSPISAFAQQPQQSDDKKKDDQKKKDDKKKDDKKKDDPYSDPYDSGSDDSSNQGNSETKIDAQGREYRTCPQCGFNMYRQGRTWTCENCGYSYVE